MLFKSYLTNGIQTVRINNKIIESSIITYGVNQGTALCPNLFNIYVNGLLNILNLPKKIYSFADDTVILVSTQTYNMLYENTNTCLDHVKYTLVYII